MFLRIVCIATVVAETIHALSVSIANEQYRGNATKYIPVLAAQEQGAMELTGNVQVPINWVEGDTLQTETPDGQSLILTVPPGTIPGSLLAFTYKPRFPQIQVAPMAFQSQELASPVAALSTYIENPEQDAGQEETDDSVDDEQSTVIEPPESPAVVGWEPPHRRKKKESKIVREGRKNEGAVQMVAAPSMEETYAVPVVEKPKQPTLLRPLATPTPVEEFPETDDNVQHAESQPPVEMLDPVEPGTVVDLTGPTATLRKVTANSAPVQPPPIPAASVRVMSRAPAPMPVASPPVARAPAASLPQNVVQASTPGSNAIVPVATRAPIAELSASATPLPVQPLSYELPVSPPQSPFDDTIKVHIHIPTSAPTPPPFAPPPFAAALASLFRPMGPPGVLGRSIPKMKIEWTID